jgi:hypothetical protein
MVFGTILIDSFFEEVLYFVEKYVGDEVKNYVTFSSSVADKFAMILVLKVMVESRLSKNW